MTEHLIFRVGGPKFGYFGSCPLQISNHVKVCSTVDIPRDLTGSNCLESLADPITKVYSKIVLASRCFAVSALNYQGKQKSKNQK